MKFRESSPSSRSRPSSSKIVRFADSKSKKSRRKTDVQEIWRQIAGISSEESINDSEGTKRDPSYFDTSVRNQGVPENQNVENQRSKDTCNKTNVNLSPRNTLMFPLEALRYSAEEKSVDKTKGITQSSNSPDELREYPQGNVDISRPNTKESTPKENSLMPTDTATKENTPKESSVMTTDTAVSGSKSQNKSSSFGSNDNQRTADNDKILRPTTLVIQRYKERRQSEGAGNNIKRKKQSKTASENSLSNGKEKSEKSRSGSAVYRRSSSSTSVNGKEISEEKVGFPIIRHYFLYIQQYSNIFLAIAFITCNFAL